MLDSANHEIIIFLQICIFFFFLDRNKNCRYTQLVMCHVTFLQVYVDKINLMERIICI